jgi:hypothetical protein
MRTMKCLTLITIAATAASLTVAPADAKSKKKHRFHGQHYGQVYGGPAYGGPVYGGYGWRRRAASDPSLGHPSADEVSRWNGRCVEDLGYGRYEACGW